jgi:hypothetical protein
VAYFEGFLDIGSNFVRSTWRFGGVVNAIASNAFQHDSYSSLRAQVRILQASNVLDLLERARRD